MKHSIKNMALLALVGLLTASGCSNTTKPQENNGSGSSKGAGNEGQKQVETVTLRMAWWGSQDRHDITIKMLELFQKKNPNIKVMPEFAGDGYFDKLAVQVSGGSAPDIINMSYAYISDYVSRGALLPLDGLGINLSDVDEGTISTGKLDGKLYGISTGNSAQMFVYDPTLLSKAGVTLPEHMTWEELKKIATQVSEKVGGSVFGVTDLSTHADILWYFARQQGMDFYKDGRIGFTPELLTEFFDYWASMRKAGAVPTPEISASFVGAPLEKSALVTGSTAMMAAASNAFPSYSTLVPQKLDLTFIPRSSNGKTGALLLPSQFWTINSKTKYPEAAAKLIDFMTNDPEAAQILGANRGIPISKKIRDLLMPTLDDVNRKHYEYINKVSEIAKPATVIEPKGAGEVRSLLVNTAQEVQFNKKSSADAAKDFINKANQILERAQKK